jgi:D-beta-D-heptose 7-phosphate kinase/D-beta-D-heptose 1-phosphate adenosyltransferase
MDLAALHARVLACGVTGGDSAGPALRDALAKEGVDATGLIEDTSRPTTLKQNLIGLAQSRHPQKMFRVDVESREPISDDVATQLARAIEDRLAQADVVIIEDYAKGVCSEALCARVIAAATRLGKPVFVDPARGAPIAKYRGANAITPNRTEAELAANLPTERSDDLAAQASRNARLASKLMQEADLEAVVLTLDKHGALLFERGSQAPTLIPTLAREVYDVSGAGDMFIAGLAAARANRCDWDASVHFANAAAGLEVEVFGVQPIPFAHVRDALLRAAGASIKGNALALDHATAHARDQQRKGKKVVFTNGCFDVLHSGHVTLLEQAAALGDYLIVGLNADESVRRLKGPSRPVNNQVDRARVLAALSCVDCVVLFGDAAEAASAPTTERDTPLRLIQALRPDVLVKGGDYTRDTVVGASIVEAHGGRVAIIPLVAGKSTTATIERLKS